MAGGDGPIPRGMITFLFSDVVGSTRHWATDPGGMSESLRIHDRILRHAITTRSGFIFTTAGDSFAAAFHQADAAVQAAVEVQSELANTDWGSLPPLLVRMGIHLGEAEERDGDYFGPTLNTAARLEDAGHGGQILISDVVQHAARIDATDLGEHRLRDIDVPIRIYQVGESTFPPLRGAGTISLPIPSSNLIGREGAVRTVRNLLADHQLVTLTGTSGCGKTLAWRHGRRPRTRVGLFLALATVMAVLTACGRDGPAVMTPAIPVPPEVASSGGEWPLPGHDYANSRTALDSPIVASDIDRLRPAWQVPTPGALTTAVLVVGDTVYAQDDHGVVVAVDRATGRVRWQSAPAGFTVGPEGVAVGWDKVFAATSDGVEALDEKSGRVVWTRQLTTAPTEGVDAQPTLVGHRVLMATVPVTPALQYGGGARGELFAVDAGTGRVDWSFDTVASKSLWGNPGVNSGGGAWYPPAVDQRTGVVYWGTANPAPFPGTTQYPNGSSRPGPNLYTDSTVALDLATGRLVWFRQAVPHDIFDQDFVHALLVPVHDGSQEVVVGTGKGGQVLGMDPATGRLRWRTSVGRHENHGRTALLGPTTVLPGTYGGVLTPPAAADGTVYLPVLNAPTRSLSGQDRVLRRQDRHHGR